MFSERLKSARKMAGLSLEELANKIGGITRQALNNYEKGKRKPDSESLIKIANALGLRPEYFLRKDIVKVGVFEYRKKSKLGVKEQNKIEELARDIIERYIEIEDILRIKNKFENPLKSLIIKEPEDIEKAAKLLRDKWELGLNPIPKLIETLEEKELKVVSLEANENFDGLAADTGNFPVIMVNKNIKDIVRLRFTVAHELGHLILNQGSTKTDKEKEKLCHRFAGAFLLPDEILISIIGSARKSLTLQELISLKEDFGISIQAIAARLHDLGIINDNMYRNFNITIRRRKWNVNEPGKYPGSENAERFENLVFRAVSEEIISISKAASLLNCSIDELEGRLEVVV
ncbi:MAG: XRE family transcriptional regulator [Ignavibacteriaceae bacterium]